MTVATISPIGVPCKLTLWAFCGPHSRGGAEDLTGAALERASSSQYSCEWEGLLLFEDGHSHVGG